MATEMATETAAEAITQAVEYIQHSSSHHLAPTEVVSALLTAEKQSKRTKQRYTYEQLLGSWKLGFVSGTQTKRPKPGAKSVKAVGKGRFLPQFIAITITYEAPDKAPDEARENELFESASLEETAAQPLKKAGPLGQVRNTVKLAGIQLQLTGPTRYWPATNSLGFDFTNIRVDLGSLTVYNGSVRGGKVRNQAFQTESLKDQAFFTFFAVEDDYLAARGKGGGLALWTRL